MLIALLFLSSLSAILFSLFVKKQRFLIESFSLVSMFIEVIVGIAIVIQVLNTGDYSWSSFSVNSLEAIILSITVLVGFGTTCHSIGYFSAEFKKGMLSFTRFKESYILLKLFLLSMYVAILTTNPIIMWLAIEATTLSTVFLVGIFNRKEDVEAAWKYLVINSVGLLLGLLGTLLFLSQALSLNDFVTWNELYQTAQSAQLINPVIIRFAFIFIFIGYGTKMGLAPMHTWKPDAYNKAPLPVVALLSGALLNVALIAILRFKILTDVLVGEQFTQILFIIFGILSILLPAFFIYTQTNYKRLLAYSSIEHAGIILLGFGFGGLGVFAAILHIIYHSFGKSLLFLLSSTIAVKYSSSEIDDVKGLLHTLPWTSKLYVIAFFAVSGIPPFGIFITEFYILLAGFSNYPYIVLAALAGFLLVFVGFYKKVFAMLFGEPDKKIVTGEISRWTVLPVIGMTLTLIILSVYLPPSLRTLISASEELFLIK